MNVAVKACDNREYDQDSEDNTLGHELFSGHNLNNRDDFDNSYSV